MSRLVAVTRQLLDDAGSGDSGLGPGRDRRSDDVEARSRARSRPGFAGLIVSGHEAGGWGGAESSFVLLQRVLAECESAGLGAGRDRAQRRGGLRRGRRGGGRARWGAAPGPRITARSGMARADRPLGRQRDHGRRPGVGTGSSRLRAARFGRPGAAAERPPSEGGAAWEAAVRDEVGWRDGQCLPVGQDAALAERLARKFVTVGGIVQAVERAISEGIAAARAARPLAEGSPLAVAHGTRYPILQGPMTRVSDVRRVRPGRGARRRLAVSGPGAVARSGGPDAVARRRRPARGAALGRGHPGLRAAGAARRAAGRRSGTFGRRLP